MVGFDEIPFGALNGLCSGAMLVMLVSGSATSGLLFVPQRQKKPTHNYQITWVVPLAQDSRKTTRMTIYQWPTFKLLEVTYLIGKI